MSSMATNAPGRSSQTSASRRRGWRFAPLPARDVAECGTGSSRGWRKTGRDVSAAYYCLASTCHISDPLDTIAVERPAELWSRDLSKPAHNIENARIGAVGNLVDAPS